MTILKQELVLTHGTYVIIIYDSRSLKPQQGHNSPPQMGHFEDPGDLYPNSHDDVSSIAITKGFIPRLGHGSTAEPAA